MKNAGIKARFAIIFADPNLLHRAWLSERQADAIFAPTRETYRQALAAGFDPSRTHFTGWPVRGQFYHADPSARDETLTRLGLDPRRFTVFAQGGGEGAAKFARTVESLLALDNVQVILAAGTNEGLLKHFSGRPHIHAIPFTRQIAPFMQAADVVMGKAGPNMLFETVTLGKPFIATAYIPGQEEVNLEFIQRYGLGWVALNGKAQRTLIESLVRDREKLSAMCESVERYRQMNTEATHQIPQLVQNLF